MSELENGYTKDEYFSISTKLKLTPRCPILRKCCHAVWTRYFLGFKLGGSGVSFNEFLKDTDQVWNPEEMIKEIELISFERSDTVQAIENCCPEIPLFEEKFLPSNFR